MSLAKVVHRIAKDAAFAADARKDLEGTLHREGITLEPAELRALMSALISKASKEIPWWYATQFSTESA